MAEMIEKDESFTLNISRVEDDREHWDVFKDALEYAEKNNIEPEMTMSGGFENGAVFNVSKDDLNNPETQTNLIGACAYLDPIEENKFNSILIFHDDNSPDCSILYADHVKEYLSQVGNELDEPEKLEIGMINYNVSHVESLDKAIEIGHDVMDIAHKDYKEYQLDYEIEYAMQSEPAIMAGHCGERTMAVHESIDNPGSTNHSLEAAAFSARSTTDYQDREDIVMVVGPDTTSVFVKTEIADLYADRVGIETNIGDNDSIEEREEKAIMAFGGTYHTFGDSTYIRDEIPSSDWGSISAASHDTLRMADMRDNPDKEHEEEKNIDREAPSINGR